jgi:hypothetical protein
MSDKTSITQFVNRTLVIETACRIMDDGNSAVTAMEVASRLFPQLVQYVGTVLIEQRKFRISDSQAEIPILGTYFQEN